MTWNKYIEQKYKYSIDKRVLNVILTAKVRLELIQHRNEYSPGIRTNRKSSL